MINDVLYDILMKFSFDSEDYVLYTDNTYDNEGNFNIYGAKLGIDGRLEEVDDVDMDLVFDIMIRRYKKKVLGGEL